MPLKTYHQLLDDKKLSPDAAQSRVVDALEALFKDILTHTHEQQKFWNPFSNTKPPKGLYIYGGVGRGKSMLMDLFYHQLPKHIPKRRIHFHEFMIEVHDFLHKERGKKVDNILPNFAKHLAKTTSILCFDEFQVTDVADAMILGRLFQALFEQGIIIVLTSNRPPDDLYKGGLQRDKFLPFVSFIKQHMDVLHLDSATDYRKMDISAFENTRYFTPLGSNAKQWANHMFLKLSDNAPAESAVLHVKGRDIPVSAAANGVARFTFSELCERPHGAEDYLKIARTYPTIILESIPVMNYDRRNEAKRLMTLIDAFYDEKINLYITAETSPEKLYRGHDHSFEFERTVSRLIEMSQK